MRIIVKSVSQTFVGCDDVLVRNPFAKDEQMMHLQQQFCENDACTENVPATSKPSLAVCASPDLRHQNLWCDIIRISSVAQHSMLALVDELMSPNRRLEVDKRQLAMGIKNRIWLGASFDVAVDNLTTPQGIQCHKHLSHVADHAVGVFRIVVGTKIGKHKRHGVEWIKEMTVNLHHIADAFQLLVVQVQLVDLLFKEVPVSRHRAS